MYVRSGLVVHRRFIRWVSSSYFNDIAYFLPKTFKEQCQMFLSVVFLVCASKKLFYSIVVQWLCGPNQRRPRIGRKIFHTSYLLYEDCFRGVSLYFSFVKFRLLLKSPSDQLGMSPTEVFGHAYCLRRVSKYYSIQTLQSHGRESHSPKLNIVMRSPFVSVLSLRSLSLVIVKQQYCQ